MAGRPTAQEPARHCASSDFLAAGAGLGGLREVKPLALSAHLGHAPIVSLLLDAVENPDRFHPEGNHAHATPLHQAVASGRMEVVRILVERGARVDIADRIHASTPLGWAIFLDHNEITDYLRGG